MISKSGEDQIKRVNEIYQDASDYSKVIVDNMTWELSLPDYQRLLLEDAYVTYQARILGVSVEEITRLQHIRRTYRDLLSFYNEDTVIKETEEFDKNLSFDEACQKYCYCDKNSAKKIYELMSKINRHSDYHKKGVREKFSDIPMDKIEINKEEYIALMMKQDEEFQKEIDEMLRKYEDLGFGIINKQDQDNGFGIQR